MSERPGKFSASAQKRYDGYGNPLAELVDARTELLYERPFNRQQRQLIAQVLEEQYRTLLRRGTFAELSLRITIKDGVIGQDIRAAVEQAFRAEPE